MTSVPDTVLAVWRHCPRESEQTLILPDGCRDLVIRTTAAGSVNGFVSPLMDVTQSHAHPAGDRFVGIRLVPGAAIDEAGLLKALADLPEGNLTETLSLVDAFCHRSLSLAEALASLAQGQRILNSTRSLGVSSRSLTRLLASHTGRPPIWWRNLARARQAARCLDDGRSLADLAGDLGFADQAHLSREFRRWFGVPPGAFRSNPALIRSVRHSGFDIASV